LTLASLAVAARDGAEPQAGSAVAATPHRMRRLALPPMPDSSSRVRDLLEKVGPHAPEVTAMIPEPVAGYIARHRLYERKA
jgi:nicotinic acid mononucleotide adenylyltransferase